MPDTCLVVLFFFRAEAAIRGGFKNRPVGLVDECTSSNTQTHSSCERPQSGKSRTLDMAKGTLTCPQRTGNCQVKKKATAARVCHNQATCNGSQVGIPPEKTKKEASRPTKTPPPPQKKKKDDRLFPIASSYPFSRAPCHTTCQLTTSTSPGAQIAKPVRLRSHEPSPPPPKRGSRSLKKTDKST